MSHGAPGASPLFGLRARRDGKLIVELQVFAEGAGCVVAAGVHAGEGSTSRVGPYRFTGPAEARAFVNDAAEALLYLGCDVD